MTADHYATLGLDRDCSLADIRNAYRLLAKLHHPDLNPDSPAAVQRTQALNAAHETLGQAERRTAYDRELHAAEKAPASGKIKSNLTQEVPLQLMDFLRGTELEVRVQDPANPAGRETYPLTIPPGTAPGARFRIRRNGVFASGVVVVRVRPQPNFRFKVRGSDLRCDLRISAQRAAQGGTETVPSVNGASLRVQIPRGVGRDEIVRLAGEGLPKARGGRGDLLVRITYRPEVTIKRRTG